MRKIRVNKAEFLIEVWCEIDERYLYFSIMFLDDIFLHEKGHSLSLCFEYMSIILRYFLPGHQQFRPQLIQISHIGQQCLNNFRLLQSSIIITMRRKYPNAASQPNMRPLFPGFAEPYKNENEISVSRTEQHDYTNLELESPSVKQLRPQRGNDPVQFSQQKIQKRGKIGTEMDRMEDWMTDFYNRRRQQRQLKNSSNSNLDYSTVSIVNSSSVKLPAINSLPAYANSNDQSKLVEQIRRVQNKIKELKFQRNLASTQQDKYETMRPFIELQNQNMMNMQYMMMAQQNKGHQHHCCSRNHNANNQTRVIYMPYPQPQMPQYYPPPPYPLNWQTPGATPQNYQNTAAKATPKNDKKGKTYNFKKIRKFRVAVIAVYFNLLFPKYVNIFTKKRFLIHSENYFRPKQPHYSKIITKAFDILSEINFYEISKTVEEHRKEKQVRKVTKSKTAKLVISEQYGQSKNYEIYLGDLELFLLVLLKKVHEIIVQGTFDSLIKEVSVGNLPYSFPIDNSYLEQQMYRLKFHSQKAYLLCDQLHSKALLMTSFFVKLLTYDFLFVMRQDEEWKGDLLKKNNLKKSQMIEAQMVTTQMYISGILLHRYCMDILRDQMKEVEGNVDKLDQKMIPVPMGMMAYEDKDEFDQGNLGKKKSENGGKKQRNSKDSAVQTEQFHLYQFQYIKKLKEFQSLMEEIIRKSGHNEEVKEKISDIIDEIFKRSIQNRNLEYKQIKDSILTQNKYILSKKLGVDKNFFQMPKRTNEQKNQIKELVTVIKLDKKNQNPRYEQQSMHKTSKKLTMKSIKVIPNKGKQK